MNEMIFGIGGIVLILGLWFVERRIDAKIIAKRRYRYSAQRHMMTAHEEKFFRILNDVFAGKCFVVPQVHLSALLDHKIKGQNWKGAFSHINGKSVDFCIT